MQVFRNALSLHLPQPQALHVNGRPVVDRAVVAKLSQGLGPLRDLDSAFGPLSRVGPITTEWYRAIENDVKSIPAFTEFFKTNVATTQVMLPANKKFTALL